MFYFRPRAHRALPGCLLRRGDDVSGAVDRVQAISKAKTPRSAADALKRLCTWHDLPCDSRWTASTFRVVLIMIDEGLTRVVSMAGENLSLSYMPSRSSV